MASLVPFGWTRLTQASALAHRFDGERVLLVGADPDAAPFTMARVRDGQGGFATRAIASLGFAWERASDGDGWTLRTSGARKTAANVARRWGALVREACATVDLDPRVVLTTIACEARDARPDAQSFVKAPRTEAKYPRRTGEGDPGDFSRDAEDWRLSRGAHSSHGLMQTLISTAVRARPDLFEGVDPSRYRTVLWSPENAIACGVAYLASFSTEVLADPLRTRVTYGSGGVRVPATRPNPWGAVVFDDLVPMHWIAFWNDAASLAPVAADEPAEPGTREYEPHPAAWVFAAFSLFALSVATAWGAAHFTTRATARREHAS